ncbi:hypothetical protein [uncultured Sphingomonas sp.]|uniref:hypothetical protein n=1 Tax=uncultured Sphingomonas sp. TaxID=158754 RepID=UPI0035CC0238
MARQIIHDDDVAGLEFGHEYVADLSFEPVAIDRAIDPFSGPVSTDWEAEGLRPDLVLTAPSRLPGLYAIVTDAAGEREFYYWPSQAPVRDLFRLEGCADALARSATAELLYLSGITLALFDREDRAALIRLARQLTSITASERVWGKWAVRFGLNARDFLPGSHGMGVTEVIESLGLAGVDPEREARSIFEAELADVADIAEIAGAGAFLRTAPPRQWAIVTSALGSWRFADCPWPDSPNPRCS